jgi:hypothetical protein
MKMVLRPKIQIQTNSALGLIAQNGAGTIAMIGTAQWGPIDTVQSLSTFNDGLNIFKDDNTGTDLTLIKGLDLAYANGAGSVKAIRIEDGTAATSSITIVSGSTDVITVYGKYKGTYGDNIMVTVDENAVTSDNRDVKITDGVITETYNNGGRGYTSNNDIVSAINSASTLTVATSLNNTYLVSVASQTNLSGGNDGSSSIASANYTAVLDNQLYYVDYNILLIPGMTTNATQSTIVGRLNSRASNDDLYSVFISGVAVDETITTIEARTASGKRLSLVAPAVKYTNRVSSTEQILDGSYLACAYAGVTAIGYPELSGTHKTLNVGGLSVLQSSGKEYYNNSEVESLLATRVVPVTKISGAIQSARAVTRNTSTTEVWYEQNIVNIVDYVSKQVLDLLNPYIGQPNLQRVRTVMAKNVDGILESNKRDEIISDYNPTIVNEASSPDSVTVEMTIKPTFLVNFITVSLTLDNTTN